MSPTEIDSPDTAGPGKDGGSTECTLANLEFRLLNEFQRGFPIVTAPFREISAELECEESTILVTLRRLAASGRVSRVGAVFAPRCIGASTLAAIAAPASQLSRIAALVSAHPEVNHNYERENRLNLWFVVAAADAERLAAVLRTIEAQTGCGVISLPLREEFHIDLGFDLSGGVGAGKRRAGGPPASYRPSPSERRLMAALQTGLDLVPRPFARLAMKAGVAEEEALATVRGWIEAGVVKRFGVVVRHRELGFNANAMLVWDVPDERIGAIGARLAAEPAVTLCYRRDRHRPQWSYNLYCMVHGRSRLAVEQAIGALRDRHGLHGYPNAVLFSRRCFKQQGARYFDVPEPAPAYA